MNNKDQASLLERFQRLMEITQDLASTLDLNTLLARIVNAAADLCRAQAASILLYDPVKNELYFDAATNFEEPWMKGLVVPADSSLAGWIVTHRQPIRISDAQQDPRHFHGIAETAPITTRSLLGVPMIAKDKVIGALEVINKLSGDFNQEDEELLVALGAQAAVAIENARLFQQFDLISELVHELRTPLTSLNTAAQLLVNPKVTGDLRTNLAQVIFNETTRLNELASAFLDMARLESGRMQFQAQPVKLLPLLQDCASLMLPKAQEKFLSLDLQAPTELPALPADPDRLKQVLLNLLSNAIKYTPPGGQITVRAYASEQEMVLQVSDTGVGIPPEGIQRLFEKFYRVPGTERSAQGTGLGLYISRRIVEAHRGRIDVTSQVGQGTTFEVRLPLE